MSQIAIDDEIYDFDILGMTNKEAMDIENVTGKTFDGWFKALSTGSAAAMTALVYIVKKRTQPGLRFDDVEFVISKVQLDPNGEDAANADSNAVAKDIVPGGSTAVMENPKDQETAQEVSTTDEIGG